MYGFLHKGKQNQLKLYKHNDTVLNTAGKFSLNRHSSPLPAELMQSVLQHHNLTQLGELVIKWRNDKNLEVSKVRPWHLFAQSSVIDLLSQYASKNYAL